MVKTGHLDAAKCTEQKLPPFYTFAIALTASGILAHVPDARLAQQPSETKGAPGDSPAGPRKRGERSEPPS